MRVFRQTTEARTPDESALKFGRVRVGDDESSSGGTGFEDRTPKLGFKDVAGLDSVVDDLRDVVAYVRDPGRYEMLGARPPTGILLYGEPGCGKTLLARALAGEVDVPFYFVSATSFVERFVGLGASRIRELFQTASADRPSIVFVDELDAVGRRRTEGTEREFDHTLNQLLVELDGFLGASGVITIAATNRLELLDPALIRPGRFDRKIELCRPDRAGRDAVLRLYAAGRPIASDVDWEKVAEATDGCSPAEIASLVNEAALLAARNGNDTVEWNDVRAALDRLVGGVTSMSATSADLDRRAVHEAGHALVALRLPDASPCVRSSIMACGRASAAVAWATSHRQDVSTGPQLLAELTVLMGGRAAEEVATGSSSTLAEGDLAAAAELAERIEGAGLHAPDGTPATANELLSWAKQEADQLIAADLDVVDSIAGLIRTNRSFFYDEVRALVRAHDRERGDGSE
jgi:cell division protease FtsH